MSKNIINTIGHHTFRYEPPKWTEEGCPFLSETKVEENEEYPKYKFLGNGYYFWDDNIQQAHYWGKTHYRGKYKIMECPMELKGDNFLDLVGSRDDLRVFTEIIKKLSSYREGNTLISKSIHFLQLMAKYKPECFPFTIIRSIDVTKGEKVDYTHHNKSKLLLNPQILICFYDKNEIPLHKASIL